MSAPRLATRRPTGRVAYPLVLVEGEEKAGKTYATLELTASDRIGRSFVLDLDEGTADEYAALGDYEILEHDGTWHQIIGQIDAVVAEPSDPQRPNLLAIDTATAIWDLLHRWVDLRARNSKAARKKLVGDPDAHIDVPIHLWSDAKDRWYRMINTLRAWPGIAVLICRGREVAKVQDGVPVAGETEWRVEAEKSTTYAVSCWVRMTRPHTATLIAARSLHVDVPARGLVLPSERPLEHLIFDVLGAGGFAPSTAVPVVADERRADSATIAAIRQRGSALPEPLRQRLNAHFARQRYRLDHLTVPQADDVLSLLDALETEATEHPDEHAGADRE